MNKLFVHLLVAVTCFALSVSLTSLTKLFRVSDVPIGTMALEPVKSSADFSEDEIQIREIYREYGPAQTRHDRAFFERIEADDFRLFFGKGSISREEDIRWMEGMPKNIIYNNQPQEIRMFGNSAVVFGSFEVRYSHGNVQRSNYIDVWVKRRNQWQIRSTTSGY